MEENVNASNSEGTFNIHDAIAESNGDVLESTEQQEESTGESTDVVDLNGEANNSTEGEIPETEATTEEENAEEETTEEESTDSDIVDLDVDNNTETTNEDEETTSQTNEDHYSEMLDGQFENEADLNNHLLDLESKIEELEGNTPEFANDYVKQLNDHVLAGKSAESFVRVQGANVDEMNAVEILTTELIWNNPGLSKEEATAYLEEKFPNSLDDNGELDPNNPTLKVDSNKAAKSIRDIQAEDKLVPQTGVTKEEWSDMNAKEQEEAQEAEAQANEARMEEWMQPVEDELENLKANGIILHLTEGKGFKHPVKMDEAYENELIAKVDKTLMNMGTSVKDNPNAAKELMLKLYQIDNFDKLMRAAAEKGGNSVNEEWFKQVNNPSVIARGDEAPASSETILSAEEAMMKVMGQ